MLYKRRAQPVEAMQLTDTNATHVMEWLGFPYAGTVDDWHGESILVETQHGTVLATPSDYIYKDKVDGRVVCTHVINSEAFNIIFEPVEE